MGSFGEAFNTSVGLILTGDPYLLAIVVLSLQISLIALAISAAIGVPLGALLAIHRFFGRNAIVVVINTLMGLPPVVIGLAVYLMLSRSGPLGVLDLLYTPTAMVIAQSILITPIIVALTRQTLEPINDEYSELLRSFQIFGIHRIRVLVWDGRYGLVTALLAGFGRATAEVGAVIIVGGNINHVSRVMTTTIALETSRGNLALAMALGAILLLIALAVNAALSVMAQATGRGYA